MKTIILILLSVTLSAQIPDDYVRTEPKKFDWTKAYCVADFGVTMAEFVFLPHLLREDYLKHYVVGQVIGMGGNVFYYKITHQKWLSCLLAAGTGALVGAAKEELDPYIGGVRSTRDFLWTSNGSIRGSLRVTFYLDKLRKKKTNSLALP